VAKTDKKQMFLILHNIRSCYNVGSIFRTADAAGVEKIYLCGISPTPDKEIKISKTALGAELTVPWEKYKQTWRLLEKLHKDGIKIIALEQNPKSKNIFEYTPPADRSIAIIVGHERNGLSKKILKYVDDIIEIPMFGKKESLNVAVAVGIALYQIKGIKYKHG
jgi:tRNA G18 (ribose-2'-O)-methylase SpoU